MEISMATQQVGWRFSMVAGYALFSAKTPSNTGSRPSRMAATSRFAPPLTPIRSASKSKTRVASSAPKPGTTQVGLGNTRERLRILYGARAHLKLRNGDGSVTATVVIPRTL